MSNLINILKNNKYELTKEDIENNKSDIGIHNKHGKTALEYYLENNKNPSIEIIKLLEKEKDIFDNISKTPLIYYCSNLNIIYVDKEIIEYFSNQIGFKNKNNETALEHYLSYNKNPNLEIIKHFEKEKDTIDNYSFTPLMRYCPNSNITYIDKKIIEYFSNQIGKKNKYGKTALEYYLENNKNISIEIIKLLEKEKDIFDNYSFTPLMYYCYNSNITYIDKEIIEYFSEQIGKQNKYNSTSLIYYLKFNKNPSIEIIKLLEKEKNIFGSYNETPLMYYFYNYHLKNLNPEIIEYFSNQIGKQNVLNKTALMIYLKYNNNPSIESIKLLEKEKYIFNDNNNSPLNIYCKNEYIKKLNPEIIKIFYNEFGFEDFKNHKYNFKLELDIY